MSRKREKMKKLLKVTLVAAVSFLLLSGCGSSDNTQTAEGTSSRSSELVLQSHTRIKNVHDAIMKAGEENGLKMTEFKSNTIIAEHIGEDESGSATIVFTNSNIRIIEENGNINTEPLFEAIEKALGEHSSH